MKTLFVVGILLLFTSSAFAVTTVPSTRKVCGHELSSDVTCSADDVLPSPPSSRSGQYVLLLNSNGSFEWVPFNASSIIVSSNIKTEGGFYLLQENGSKIQLEGN